MIKILIGAAVVALLSLPAHAQATRTWVSGTGDDTNPCSRSAPCRTFAGAYLQTTTPGEISCVNSGDFGAVTIGQSLTIDCEGFSAGITASGSDGVTVTAGTVNLRGLAINGVGTGASGVKITGPANVTIETSSIAGFSANGVSMTAAGTLVIANSVVQANGNGVLLDGSGGAVKMTVRDTVVFGNTGNGVTVQNSGAQATIDRSTLAKNGAAGVAITGSGAFGLLGGSVITANATGTSAASSGTLYSFQQNQIAGNTIEGTPPTPFPGPGGALQ